MSSVHPENFFKGATDSQADTRPKILIVDDDQSLREFLEILLAKEGCETFSASNGEKALLLMDREDISLVISDVKMPGIDGMTLLKEIKTRHADVPVILITAFASLDNAMAAMKEGAWDYLTKPFRLEEIREVVGKALETRPKSPSLIRDIADRIYRLDNMLTKSPVMLKIFQLIPRIASSPSSVLITGESGTGKELAARAIHNLGARKDRPFVVINCGGIPENLLESELFGHKKGAFTGANREKQGLFAIANQGTIFLDEVGELPMTLQVKLLRVVQQKSFTSLGDTNERKVDVRILAATNRDLEKEVINERFREDLYYRLNVIPIRMPPLRERTEDIPLLVQYFLDKYSKEQNKAVQGISSFAMDALQKYSFPGNVRELENIIERSVALATSNLLLPESLSLAEFKQQKSVESSPFSYEPYLGPEGLDLEQFLNYIEKTLLIKALEITNGVKTEAAHILGLNFRSFRYRLSKYAL
ncbi:MAG: Fis family transcriptional regulator [delta proteobacterium ML8_D]|jgi:two-component system, NtrC family, response regulator PilR|nr:MAG: Fis family transcriptional regulator [delta proteobacterium ML8_D]